jgi:DNA-binding transcriptional LysR family regulator
MVNPTPDERVASLPLLDDPWVILTRRDSELAAAEDPSFDLLDGLDLVGWTRRWRTQKELEDAFRRRAIAPRIVFRTDDNLALQRLVAAGYGHACLDRLGASGAVEPSLTWLEPKEILIPRTIALCHPRHRDPSAPALMLMESVRAQFGI